MHVDTGDHQAVNTWVRKAKREGWKRPRQIVETTGVLDDTYFPPSFGYCDVCKRTMADFNLLGQVKEFFGSDRFEARFEGGRDGLINDERTMCFECMDAAGLQQSEYPKRVTKMRVCKQLWK